MQSRGGGPDGGCGRKLLLPSSSDRLMLNGIRENFQHLQRQQNNQTPSSHNQQVNGELGQVRQPSQVNGELGQVRPDVTVQNGIMGKGTTARDGYNRKAMHEIRKSLKVYHIEPNNQHQVAPPVANGRNLLNNGNMVRQAVILGDHGPERARQAFNVCPTKNIEKIFEVVESISNRNGASRLVIPGYGNKVIRKQSFEEKYRTSGPIQSENTVYKNNSKHSDSPHNLYEDIVSLGNLHIPGIYPNYVTGTGINLIPFGDYVQDVYGPRYVQAMPNHLQAGYSAIQPACFVGQPNGFLQQSDLVQMQYPGVRGKSPVDNHVYRLALSCSVASSPWTVNCSHGINNQSVNQFSNQPLAFAQNSGIMGGSIGLMFNDATSQKQDDVSPLSSQSPSPVSTLSSGGYGGGDHPPLLFMCPSSVSMLNTRQNFSKLVCKSKEVEKPVAQKAIIPPTPKIISISNSSDHQKNLCSHFSIAPTREQISESTATTDQVDEARRPAPALMSYDHPFTPQQKQKKSILRNGFCFHPNNVSQSTMVSYASAILVQPTSTTSDVVVEKLPLPYPGHEMNCQQSGFFLNPSSASEEGLSLQQLRWSLSPENVHYLSNGYENGGDASCEQYAESTDGGSVIEGEVSAIDIEKQLIESPKPVRKTEACCKDAERSETQVRHYSPEAYRFYMKQRIENLFKIQRERMERQRRLEMEMNQTNLPQELQDVIRKMLMQKESNYLRQRRSKIDRSMFERLKTLGTGAFGEVDLVRKKDTNKLYALKTLQKKDVLKRNQVAHVKAERDILAEADNEWVVKLYYSFQDSANLYIVMDYIPGGDMMGLLIKLGIFNEVLTQFYIAELVLAIESVHLLGFIHRDIKPDNILIGKDGHIKLTDFGLCTGFRWTHNSKCYQKAGNHRCQDSMEPEDNWETENRQKESLKPTERRRSKHKKRCLAHSLVGTPNYIAPEVLCQQGYTECCDWWSVGVILYEMRVGQPPFLACNPTETQMKVINWKATLTISSKADLSQETCDLIRQLCCGPDQRLGSNGASEVKSHLFFVGINFESLRQQPAPYIPPLRFPTDTSNFDPVDEDKLRRSVSLESLLKEGTYDGGKHAFFEFTFRRFFDDDGHAHATRMHDPETDNAVYV